MQVIRKILMSMAACAAIFTSSIGLGAEEAAFAWKPNGVAIPVVGPLNGKCLPQKIYSSTTNLYPFPSTLDVVHFQYNKEIRTDFGELKGAPRCVYSIQLGQDGKDGGLWEMMFIGPGEVFSDGHWHSSPTELRSNVFTQMSRVVGTDRPQLIIFSAWCFKDGCLSSIDIYAYKDAFQDARILSLSAPSLIKYDVSETGILSVQACAGKQQVVNSTPVPCSDTATVSLQYDTEVHQFSIRDPNLKNVEFYKFLRKKWPALLLSPNLYFHR